LAAARAGKRPKNYVTATVFTPSPNASVATATPVNPGRDASDLSDLDALSTAEDARASGGCAVT
jgi:hypothetical protein